MDGDTVSATEKSHQSAKRAHRKTGLNALERDGHWHIVGTLELNGRTIRVRKTTGLEATAANRPAAETRAFEKEKALRDQSATGYGPNHHIAVAADRYLEAPRTRPIGASTVAIVLEIVKEFGIRRIRDVPESEWVEWADKRQAGNKSETRERFLNGVVGFLNWCAKKPRRWIHRDQVPEFDRDNAARNPRRRARRPVEDLRLELIEFMISQAAPHLVPQLWTEWSTGARVSSILHGCALSDVVLAQGREQITFHNTKNATSVTAALHPRAAQAIADYLEIRGKLHWREGPLFLNHEHKPYAPGTGKNRKAFNSMKRRARKALRLGGMQRARASRGKQRETIVARIRADHRLLGRVTQHWFRHLMATRMRGDIRAAMDQAGWLDERSVMGYTIDVPEHRRDLINQLDQDPAGVATNQSDRDAQG